MFRRFVCSQAIVFAAMVACGDQSPGDDGGSTPDAGQGDGSTPDGGEAADAASAATRTGTIAISETTITNDDDLAAPRRGAAVSIAYVDDQSVTVAPVAGYRDPLVDGCAVTVYDRPGEQEPHLVGEGAVSVRGIPSHGDFTCSSYDGRYRCQSDVGALRGGDAEGATLIGNGTAGTLTFPSSAGLTQAMVGMSVVLTGFAGDVTDGRPFGIVAVNSDNVLQLTSVPNTGGQLVGGADATWASYIGAGPIPIDPRVTDFDFLDDGAADILVSKEGSRMVPSFDVTASARGEGFALADGSDKPHELPTALPTEDVSFTCTGDGCGAPGRGQVQLMVATGETTDVLPATGDDGTIMLPAEGSYATFTCVAIVMDTVTIPAGAMEAILGTSPARIRVTVGRFVDTMVSHPGGSSTEVLVGHSLTGFTTIAAE